MDPVNFTGEKITASREDINTIVDHATAGRKIQAIKVVRMLTGMGLREAKDWVEGNCYYHPSIGECGTPRSEELIRSAFVEMNVEDSLRHKLARAEAENKKLVDLSNQSNDEIYRLRQDIADLEDELRRAREVARDMDDHVTKEEHEAAIQQWRTDYAALQDQLVKATRLRMAYQTIVELMQEDEKE